MNKKGFTLVELLAVIVILGLLMTIVATKGFGAFDNTKKAISTQNQNQIKEAINIVIEDIENCDDELNEYDELSDLFNPTISTDSCSNLKQSLSNSKNLNISKLITKEYLSAKDISESSSQISLKLDNNTNKIYATTIINGNLSLSLLKSNNKDKHNTTARTEINFTTNDPGILTFDWIVSSETNWDYLTIKLNSQTLVYNVSGTKKGSISKELTKGTNYSLVFEYNKDHSVSGNDDIATIKNLSISSININNAPNIVNSDYYFN